MTAGGSGNGVAQDATLQAVLAKLGLSTPQGGSGTGIAQDASLQVLLTVIGGSKLSIVRVNATGASGAQASPYAAKVYDTVIVDASLGPVVVNLPALTLGQWVRVQQDSGTALTSTITVNPSSGNLDQPPPDNGTFVASFVYGPATSWTTPSALGMDLTWFDGGSASGLLLA